jgi:RNA polymerase sigma factor (TIGR02999 family)
MGEAPLTDLIQRALGGDGEALRRVFEATYQDLRRLARMRLSDHQRGPYLDTTALVHESYLRFADAGELKVEDRRHFLHYAAQVMRSVMIDCVRERRAERRGGEVQHVALTANLAENAGADEEQLLAIDQALQELARHDERMVRVVEMRYFAGMKETEIADALQVTERTVRRDWEKARVILATVLG